MVCYRAMSGSLWSVSIYNDLTWQCSGQSFGRGLFSDSAGFGDNEVDGIML